MLLQCGSVVAFGAVGTALCRAGAARAPDVLLGVGLLVGAFLTAIDSLTVDAGVPLAGWAVLVFALLGHGDGCGNVARQLVERPLRLFGAALACTFLLHWVHQAMPVQPTVQLVLPWRLLDLGCAAALGWFAWTRNALEHETKFLFAATAFGLASTSLPMQGQATIAALLLVVGTAPWLLRLLQTGFSTVSIAGTTAAAFVLTCALRATCWRDGLNPTLAGLDDPLLVIAMLFLVLGCALLLPPVATTATPSESEERAHAGTPTPTPTAADASDAVAPTASPAPGATATATTTAAATSRPFSAQDLVRDMRTPLTSMMATAGLLTGNASEREAQLTSLQAYGRQLSGMMADLDDFERLLRGSVDLAEDTFDFPQLVRNCVTEVAPSVADRGIEIRVDVISGTPRWVQGDPSRVRQLLGRLLEGAAGQCTLGPLEVTVFAEETHLGVVIQNRTQTAIVDVHSFGHLFCRQLTLSLGGELAVVARDGGGTESRLTLPKHIAPDWEIDLLEEDTERAGGSAPAAPMQRVHGKVLLVDDSTDHQRLIGQLLARAGAEVTSATGGAMALQLLEEMTFDLVLLDMQMPEMDGYTTIAELRQRGITTPVLAITADTGQADIERALAGGCNGHLAKPIDHELLQRSLAMHLPIAAE